jgi:hypothetical protein
MRKRKYIVCDSATIELYVDRELEKSKAAQGKVEDLMATFKYLLKMCLRDCRKQDPMLKRFRIKVK